jgi:hypothetical protein
LGHIGNAGIVLHLQVPSSGFSMPTQDSEQGRFAGPVAADQAHTLRRFKGKI